MSVSSEPIVNNYIETKEQQLNHSDLTGEAALGSGCCVSIINDMAYSQNVLANNLTESCALINGSRAVRNSSWNCPTLFSRTSVGIQCLPCLWTNLVGRVVLPLTSPTQW